MERITNDNEFLIIIVSDLTRLDKIAYHELLNGQYNFKNRPAGDWCAAGRASWCLLAPCW